MIGDPLTLIQAMGLFAIATNKATDFEPWMWEVECQEAIKELFARGLIREHRTERNLYFAVTDDGARFVHRMLEATRAPCAHRNVERVGGGDFCINCKQLVRL